jgi:hypothetical protein
MSGATSQRSHPVTTVPYPAIQDADFTKPSDTTGSGLPGSPEISKPDGAGTINAQLPQTSTIGGAASKADRIILERGRLGAKGGPPPKVDTHPRRQTEAKDNTEQRGRSRSADRRLAEAQRLEEKIAEESPKPVATDQQANGAPADADTPMQVDGDKQA